MSQHKVLYITYQYPPCASSGVFRTIRFLKNLPENNWEPLVLTVYPKFYRNEPLDDQLTKGDDCFQKLSVYRTKVMPGAEEIISSIKGKRNHKNKDNQHIKNDLSIDLKTYKTSLWQHIKDAISLTFMIPDKQNGWIPYAVKNGMDIIRRQKPSVIYASGRPWSAFLIGVILKRLTRIPLVIDFRDPWIDNPYAEYQFILRDKINSFLERKCIQTADRVIANTEPLRRLFIQKYGTFGKKKFITITNGFDVSEFEGLDYKSMEKKNDPIIVSHIGVLYSKRNPEYFLSAISSLIQRASFSKKDVRIRFVGKVNIDGLKKKLKQDPNSCHTEFMGHVTKKKALTLAAESDILLLIQPDTELQIPAKLFEYIRLGIPIFAVCGKGATKEIVASNDFGIVAEYDDLADIADKFQIIYNAVREGKYSQDSINRESKISQFDSRVLTSRLADLFNSILKDSICP